MPELTIKEVKQTVDELRTIVESKNANLAENKERVDKIEKALDEKEAKNQELLLSIKAKENEQIELKEKVDKLETVMSRGDLSGQEEKEAKAEVKAFEKAMIHGIQTETGQMLLTPEELKYLRTDNDVQGGYLAPLEYVEFINKQITEITPVRTLARVRQTSRKGIEIPKRVTLQSATRPGEGGTTTAANSEYGMSTIYTHQMTAITDITRESLNDSAFDMQSEITMDFAEQFAVRDGSDFVNGTGISMPEGFLVAAGTTELNSGIANSYDADAVIELSGELKTGYNPIYGMRRTEINFVRRLKDGNGQYLWVPGLSAGTPNQINGFPYVEMPNMPAQGANTNPIVFADFFRGYTWVDGVGMTVVRDIYTQAATGKVRFVGYMFDGGGVVLGEAIAKLKCSV